MSDPNQNLAINIRTDIDSSGAEAAQKYLDADTESATALADAFRQCEVRLQELLASLNDPALKNTVPLSPASDAPLPLDSAGQPSDVAPPPPATDSEFFLSNKGELETATPLPSDPKEIENPFAPAPTSDESFQPNAAISNVSLPIEAMPPPLAQNSFDDDYGDLQSDSQQLLGVINQFRSGWEENSRVTVSLFDQMLPLMTQQTDQLRELQRALSDLSGQILAEKSLTPMNWTISCNGVEKTLADWGLAHLTRRLVSQGMDELTFSALAQPVDQAPLFPFAATLTLWRDRAISADGSFSGGTTWFAGRVIRIPRHGSATSESAAYRVAGPWWYLDNYIFQQPYQNIFLGYAVAGDPTTALYGPGSSSHLFLNQADVPEALEKITTGQQIIEALNWVLKPFSNAGVTPPFQIGTVTPQIDVPIDEVRDITCAEVIHKMLRWSPDAVTWFDYTTTPPTFHCARRPELNLVALDLNQDGRIADLSINPRYDLRSPSVQIFYETASSINGTSSLSLVKDFYPNPLPIAPADQFASLQFTVDLQGIQSTITTARLVCDPINATDPEWWLLKHPQYQPYNPANPADENNPIASFDINPDSLQRAANPALDSHGAPIADLGYTAELTSGQLTDWMAASPNNFKSQRITIACKALVTYRNGTQPREIPISYQCLSTNATSGTYQNQKISAYPEPVPIGLAQFIYDSISDLQFEGSLTLLEPEVSGALLLGNRFNLIGGALAEWSTMSALIQSVSETLDTGATQISFGVPRHLSAGDLIDLLRVNRSRVIRSSFSMRPDGSPSENSGDIELGRNTPEKNSSSTIAPANPHVVSESIDGTGAIINHSSSGGDCSTTWFGVPAADADAPAGSVAIKLSDAQGQSLKIQPLPLCLNGVQGTMYFLCSNFIPDPA